MQKIRKVTTKGMSRETWLSLRKKSIGGSDAAGILGISPYSTPYTVWADKTGRLPDKEDTEAMRQGRDLEEYVARRFVEKAGKKVKKLPAFLYNPLYPFAHANVDRMVVGEDAGLECKTTSTLDIRQFNGVDFPEKYYAQCVHYLAVTGCERWYLAVLLLGRDFFVYTLERDQAEIDALMRAEEAFWAEHVIPGIPPAPDGAEPTTDAISTIYRESNGEDGTVALFGRQTIMDEYFLLTDQISEAKERMDQIANIIKLDMGEADRAECGGYKVLWKTQRRKSFQTKDFEKDYPEIDLTPYYKKSSSRPFKITKNKEDV